MNSMTLKQIRDQLRDLHDNLETDASTVTELRVMADAIDAHLAGMGEPVATSCADHVKGETGYCTFSAKVPWGTRLFAAPSIDLAAVRDVIASHIEEAKKLRHDPESQDYLYEQASKLEVAIKGAA